MAMSRLLVTRSRNAGPGTAPTTQRVMVQTQAERGRPSMAASSPNTSPFFSAA